MQGRVAGHGQLAAHVQRDGTPPGRGQDILGRLVFRQGLTAEQFQAARDGCVAAHRHLDGLAQRRAAPELDDTSIAPTGVASITKSPPTLRFRPTSRLAAPARADA